MRKQDDSSINIHIEQRIPILKNIVKIFCALLLFGIVLLFFVVLLELE
jgi:hypothetical protein